MTFTDRQKLVAVSPIFLATGLLARPKQSRVFFRAGPEKKEGSAIVTLLDSAKALACTD
jgi:hypothetical protein